MRQKKPDSKATIGLYRTLLTLPVVSKAHIIKMYVIGYTPALKINYVQKNKNMRRRMRWINFITKLFQAAYFFVRFSPYPSIGRAAFISGLFTPKG
ncbi:hypothetical protein DMN77_00795 [Paenibacillus sp. 79R4]|uniref:hypothetical protein n=1 Tax=Paenibacillus sp. 79R4 TaxID=2212847 RepID=UPI0015BC9227|nr:hypothetical protein [Paenibacillus sp. 79R4]NWL86131.1 hypothetical protein [Paenibacillus sp. 79R4]